MIAGALAARTWRRRQRLPRRLGCCTTSARRSTTRSRGRTPSSAPISPSGWVAPRRSCTPSPPTTAKRSRRPSRRSSWRRPTPYPVPGQVLGGKWSRPTSSGWRRSKASPIPSMASKSLSPSRRGARSGFWSHPIDRRPGRGAAGARCLEEDRGESRVSRSDQGHGHSRNTSGRLRALALPHLFVRIEQSGVEEAPLRLLFALE